MTSFKPLVKRVFVHIIGAAVISAALSVSSGNLGWRDVILLEAQS